MPDGRRIISGSLDTTIRVWATDTARELAVVAEHVGEITALACDASGQLLASADRSGQIRIWELPPLEQDKRTMPRLRSTFQIAQSSVYLMVFSPDASQLAMWITGNTSDKLLGLYDVKTGKPLRVLAGHDRSVPVTCVSFSKDARYAAVGGQNGDVRVWNMTTGEMAKAFSPFSASVVEVAFSSDARQLLLASPRGEVQVRDWASDKVINSWNVGERAVLGLTTHPREPLVASWHPDGTVNIWEQATGKMRATFRLPSLVTTLEFVGQSRCVVGTASGTLYMLTW
jgi:YD repeat-containing protein